MGIKGLKAIIKKHAPESFTEVTLASLRGSRICIDSSILLYKFRYTYNSDNFHILGFLHKIIEFNDYDIKCIFVFDGKPPEAKKAVLNKRKERVVKQKEELQLLKETHSEEFIDSDNETETFVRIKTLEKLTRPITKFHSTEVMELLKSIGIPFFVSDSEAEKACVYLQNNNFVDYILTEDTDSLTFGGSSVLFGSKLNKFKFMKVDLEKVLKGLELTYPEFIDFCILSGCDYTCTIPRIGPVTALKLIKKHGFIQNLNLNLPEEFNYQLARDLFKIKDINFSLDPVIKDRSKFVEILSRYNMDEKYFKIKFCEILI